MSRGRGDAAPPDTPAPVKLTGPDAAQRSAQLVTQLQGARHAPASRALPRVVGSRRTTCARPARHLGFGGVPPLSPRRREGSVCAACSEGRSLGRSLCRPVPRRCMHTSDGALGPACPSLPNPSRARSATHPWPGSSRPSPLIARSTPRPRAAAHGCLGSSLGRQVEGLSHLAWALAYAHTALTLRDPGPVPSAPGNAGGTEFDTPLGVQDVYHFATTSKVRGRRSNPRTSCRGTAHCDSYPSRTYCP